MLAMVCMLELNVCGTVSRTPPYNGLGLRLSLGRIPALLLRADLPLPDPWGPASPEDVACVTLGSTSSAWGRTAGDDIAMTRLTDEL